MDNELAEVTTFVGTIPPFDLLPDTLLDKVIREISISYLRVGEHLSPDDIEQPQLYILRKGALRYLDANKELTEKYAEGDICAIFCQNRIDLNTNIAVIVDEDSLIYSLDYKTLKTLLVNSPEVIDFLEHSSEQRLHSKKSKLNEAAILSSSISNTSVEDFYHHPVATIPPSSTIQEAAIKMTKQGFSCLVVVDENNINKLGTDMRLGIVTDKDIRRRCVALGLPITNPVNDIMTEAIATIDIKCNAYDALIAMTSKHIHHLPVTKLGKLVGMVSVTDLVNNEEHNAVNMTSIIHKASSVAELVTVSKLLNKLQVKLTTLGANADHIGKSISAITMAFTIRLIEMAEQKLGAAPVPYAWLAAGSQARQEQLAHSDQDNALIICDSMKAEDDVWFIKLASFVSDGLDECGFIYCPGDIMATNKQWRQPQKIWQQYFDEWVDIPSPKSLLNSSVFFDLTTIYGDVNLLEKVRRRMLEKTKVSSLFIAHMTSNALRSRPPLGFFRNFVLIQDGKHNATLDLKHNGIAPIVDLARIYALSEGVAAVNTLERLQLCSGTQSLTKSSAENLIDAYVFLTSVRLEHQAKLLFKKLPVNSYIDPKNISTLEREHLKDAFKVIKSMQDYRQSAVI
ncbi:putative nucleotidyltransferase substrate binding domain-containing protein [Paraglaciecola sp. L3A3]|uniref:putative nucleotidyltransferase substrate binding domain-containing protein n=1 Tax=Paraglaciecola sp. L3A3 TaxID=2686358 RepID=UPI00131C29B6|nr:putative nucleotidyltransferase substrate binding domain-containing protein [Paraglaciecola sp. L3A3]